MMNGGAHDTGSGSGSQVDDEMAPIMDYATGIGKDVRYIKP